jgi:hypothetical protein
MAQQGGEYVPFLTGELNRAIGNQIAANKPILDLLKMVSDKAKEDPFSPSDGSSETSGTNYVSPEMAVTLIHQNRPSIYDNKELIEAKEATLIGLPDVSARNQDLSSIGIKKDKGNDLKDTENGNLNLHNNRPNRVPDTIEKAEDFIA